MVEDECLVVDEDAIEQKPDEQKDDRHCPHRPIRRLHVLAVPCSERNEAEHNHPEDEHLVLHQDRHVCRLVYTPILALASFAISLSLQQLPPARKELSDNEEFHRTKGVVSKDNDTMIHT